MKRFAAVGAVSALIVLLAQCAPKSRTAVTATSPAGTPVVKNTADAEKGKVIYQSSCGRCHKLFAPESRTLAQWHRILPEMYRKAKLGAEEAQQVDAYVLPLAKAS